MLFDAWYPERFTSVHVFFLGANSCDCSQCAGAETTSAHFDVGFAWSRSIRPHVRVEVAQTCSLTLYHIRVKQFGVIHRIVFAFNLRPWTNKSQRYYCSGNRQHLVLVNRNTQFVHIVVWFCHASYECVRNTLLVHGFEHGDISRNVDEQRRRVAQTRHFPVFVWLRPRELFDDVHTECISGDERSSKSASRRTVLVFFKTKCQLKQRTRCDWNGTRSFYICRCE